MPNLKDYLLAPWKIFGLLFSSPTVQNPAPPGTAPSGTQVAAVVHQGLCYVQDSGGQLLHVCHVGSYEMPRFIFFASLLIVLLFAAASLTLLLQCARLARVLSKISDDLSRLPGAGKSVNGETLAQIRALMQRESLMAPFWNEFEDTLLVSTTTAGGEVYATSSPEKIIAKSALIEQNVSAALFNSIPGILTGVGLLMTFVAILEGLSHVSVSANMDVTGIGGLINGLSGKFVSSIVAVTCAVSFVFVERIAYSGPDRSYRKILDALSGRFKRRTTEHLLHDIQTQLQEQAALFQKLQSQGRPHPKSQEL